MDQPAFASLKRAVFLFGQKVLTVSLERTIHTIAGAVACRPQCFVSQVLGVGPAIERPEHVGNSRDCLSLRQPLIAYAIDDLRAEIYVLSFQGPARRWFVGSAVGSPSTVIVSAGM